MKILQHLWKYHQRGVIFADLRYLNTYSTEKFPSSEEKLSHAYLPKSYLNTGSVYVHWPYCRQRCSYCNFVKFIPHPNSHWTIQDNILEDAMKVLAAIEEVCHLEENAEITLEGNPTSLETKKLKDFRAVKGINRVSIGVQALDESSLRLLNRDHSIKEAMQCIHVAKQLFPGRMSIDLIFGRPAQTTQSWAQELEKVLSFCDDHISLYQLTVERGTKLFCQVKSGEVIMPSTDQMADLYEVAVSLLDSSGFTRYEVSNFARGYLAECVHNKSYWQGLQYIGVGPGAHSRVVPKTISENNSVDNLCISKFSRKETHFNNSRNNELHSLQNNNCLSKNDYNNYTVREARVNAADPANWLREVTLNGSGVRKITPQTMFDVICEYVASGLRTNTGITAETWNILLPHITLWEAFHESTVWLQENKLLQVSSERVKATRQGLNVLDSILPYLLNILEEKFTKFD
ncbi:radical S-adenosyl methionine domain-containing protein 1, mitochondrial-like isoform X2 [Homarus americanus]|uniref:radical S-adenosyl methionine domain-containing protein 1, mitochondrial-like isoform X2 n=1 Tax=Homarus americanus TaxID=6706 RepID=UPI001C4628E1|nr:radical S-adenosyl methionine domain-containing protein 1, mitochondrial-like isoform X2 [Homarus americanus]